MNQSKMFNLCRSLLDPEKFGLAVTEEVRDAARSALGLHKVNTKEYNMPQVEISLHDPRFFSKWSRPHYETNGAAAIDLRACVEDVCVLKPNKSMLISAGFSMAIEPGWAGLIIPRSGRGHKEGLVVGNLTGLIDSDYRGMVYISAWNRGVDPIRIFAGERIAQMIFVPAPQASLEFVKTLTETGRGSGSFGSTGNG